MALHLGEELAGPPGLLEEVLVHDEEVVLAGPVGDLAGRLEELAARAEERAVRLAEEVRGAAETAAVDAADAGDQEVRGASEDRDPEDALALGARQDGVDDGGRRVLSEEGP